MIPNNNYDKLNIVKLFIIIKALQQQQQQPCCNEDINLISEKNSTNINHKKSVPLNNSNVKKNSKEKINTNYGESFISTLPIIIAKQNMDIHIEPTVKLKNATLDINSRKKHIYLINSKVLPMYENDDLSPS